MDDSPFRRIVLPALLTAGTGFAALTWPLASDQAARMSERLPAPLDRWADSALVTYQHKEFSIRYIGFAILSSVAIGIGTAEVMRSHLVRSQRRQGLLDQVLAETDQGQPWLESLNAFNLDSRGGPGAEPSLSHPLAEPKSGIAADDALDWAGLLRGVSTAEGPALATPELLPMPLAGQPFYHIQGAAQSRCLALAVEGEYYSYYRSRPSLDKARSLVQYLHRRGRQAIATGDDSGYVVWVHQPHAAPHATPWAPAAIGD